MTKINSFIVGIGQITDLSGSFCHLQIQSKIRPIMPYGLNRYAENVRNHIKKAVDEQKQNSNIK